MTTVLYPGTFDPIHNGHLEIIETASRLFDRVVVAAIRTSQKGDAVFDYADRESMILDSTSHLGNVEVVQFASLVVDLAREVGADVIVKGLRAVSDFDYELQMAQMNASLTDVETVFVPTSPEWSFLASSLVKEVATYGGDVSTLVPDFVHERLAERIAENAARNAARG